MDDGETKAKGFCHVKIDDYGDFVEVITSRAKRRIQGEGAAGAECFASLSTLPI